MVRVVFPAVLARHVECPPMDVVGCTVRQCLEAAFRARPELRGYVLDDQGALRQHMTIFVNGVPMQDRARQGDAVPPQARIDILQALSGG